MNAKTWVVVAGICIALTGGALLAWSPWKGTPAEPVAVPNLAPVAVAPATVEPRDDQRFADEAVKRSTRGHRELPVGGRKPSNESDLSSAMERANAQADASALERLRESESFYRPKVEQYVAEMWDFIRQAESMSKPDPLSDAYAQYMFLINSANARIEGLRGFARVLGRGDLAREASDQATQGETRMMYL